MTLVVGTKKSKTGGIAGRNNRGGDPLGRNYSFLYGYYGPGENESHDEALARIGKGSIESQAREKFAPTSGIPGNPLSPRREIKGIGVMGVPYRDRGSGGETGDNPYQPMKQDVTGRIVPQDTWLGDTGINTTGVREMGTVWKDKITSGSNDISSVVLGMTRPRKPLTELESGEDPGTLMDWEDVYRSKL
jgi:hypothetical protein